MSVLLRECRTSGQSFGSPESPKAFRILRDFLLVAAGLASFGCGSDRPPASQPDTSPPAKVNDLAANALNDSTILLTWTAPGDDGASGTAEQYDIRYSSTPFPDAGHFPGYPSVPNIPPPASSGTPEELPVPGLMPKTRYYFAMRVRDDADNLSPMSNIASDVTDTMVVVVPPDTTAPAAVMDLRHGSRVTEFLTLAWTAPGDDGTTGRASSYDLRWSFDPIDTGNWQDATPVPGVPTPRMALSGESVGLALEQPLRSRYFCLRTTDDAGNKSDLSNLLLVPSLMPGVRTVLADGTGDYPTIQAALDAGLQGDTILVGPGDYRVNLVFPPVSLLLRSEAGPEVTRLTAVDPSRPIMRLAGEAWSSWTIEGFTVEGDGMTEGGGIQCTAGRFTVRDCDFLRNHARWSGAIEVRTVQPTGAAPVLIESSRFAANSCYWNGGAIGVRDGKSHVIVRDCTFTENLAPHDGGAIWMHGTTAKLEVSDCTFVGNKGNDHGGAIYVAGSSVWPVRVEVARNLLLSNESLGSMAGDTGSGGGIYLGGLVTGLVAANTFHSNYGTTESIYGGGAIMLEALASHPLTDDLVIELNIFSASGKSAIACRNIGPRVFIRRCLAWMTDGPIFFAVAGAVPPSWMQGVQVVDPQFCDPGGGDFSVAGTSPALIGGEVIGAFDKPGCSTP